MQKKLLIVGALVLVPLVGAVAFGYHKLAGSGRASRGEVVAALARQVMLPGYQRFKDDASALTKAANDFCAAPSVDGRERLRAVWSAARTSWKRTEAYQEGPAQELRLATAIDFWPLRPWIVEAELANTAPVDAAYVQSLPAPARGLPALELLIFGPASEVLASTGARDRSCDLIVGLAGDVESSATQLLAAWQGDAAKPGYADELARSGEARMFATPQAALDVVVNQLVKTAYTIEDMKLARPLGKRHGNMPQPEALESPISQHSVADIVANLEGLRALYRGAGPAADGSESAGTLGIEALVTPVNPELNTKILAAVDQLEADIKAVTPSLSVAAENGSPESAKAFVSSTQLTRVLSAELISTLGVTATFSDNDGD